MSTVTHKTRPRGFSNPNDFQEVNILADPGNHPPSHFKKDMSKTRFAMRSYLTRFTDNQSEYLHRWQKRHRTPLGDVFFAYTSLLGSHTFYVIFLPIPLFFGHFQFIHDMVYILGYSIYISGFLKDYWCLPRPRSPPLHRITLSDYTAKEYGAPSSHTANATGASLLFIWRIAQTTEIKSTITRIGLLLIVVFYYFSLVIGRLYCGMHGLLDLASGAVVGLLCFIGTVGMPMIFPHVKIGEIWWYPIANVALSLASLYKHVRPVDECPCFEDSVSFIGVVSGFEVSSWIIQRFKIEYISSMIHKKTSFTEGLTNLSIGVPCVLLWKYALSKRLVYSTLIHVLRLQDDRQEKTALRNKLAHSATKTTAECLPYVGVAKIDILGRFLVYAGIPAVVLLLYPVLLAHIPYTMTTMTTTTTT